MSHIETTRRGFTLFDILIVLAIIAAVMAVVLPQIRDTTYVRLLAAAEIVTSDLELAQAMSIASPSDPIVVMFVSTPTPQYWLARSSDASTPIDLGDGAGPYRIIFGQGRASHIGGVAAGCLPIGSVTFDGFGAVGDFSEPVVTISSGTRAIRLEISPTTGTITQTGE